MGFLDGLRRARRTGLRRPRGGVTTVRTSDSTDVAHLTEFARTRRGVEGFVEPRTAVSEVSMMLVAHDGEWTRRRVPTVDWAHKFCNRYQVPSYDAAVVGIPQRMRDYNRRQKQSQKAPNPFSPPTPPQA